MRSLAITLGSLTFALAGFGCATDTTTDDTSLTELDSTVLDTCANSCAYNATESITSTHTFDTYTRTHADIEACKAADPGYRPTTIAQVSTGTAANGNLITARVGTWTVPNGQTGCLNSLLALRVETGAGSDVCGLHQVYYNTVSPTWVNGVCQPAELTFSAGSGAGTYVVRALAIRGLESQNHGYETVEIKANQVIIH